MRLSNLTKAVWLGAALSCSAFSHADATRVADTVISWDSEKAIDFVPLQPLQIPADKANMIFYRPADGLSSETDVNIGLNGRYLTSLSSGNYVESVSCAATSLTSVNETAAKSNDLFFDAQQFVMPVRTNQYFKVTSDGSKAYIDRVDQDTALQEIQGMERQTHMVDRTQYEGCPEVPLAPIPAAPEEEVLALEDIYYFGFDIRDADATEERRAEEFARKVIEADISGYQVYVAGYADPVGTNRYNDKLADDRAKDIVQIYVESGIPIDRIMYRSFGETKPVVECTAKYSSRALRNECNARNRRVNVQITTQ